MKQWIPYIAVVGAVLLLAGSFLPLWEKNGIGVNAWEGHYLAVGRWVLILVTMAAVGFSAAPTLRRPRWVGVAGLVGLLEAGLVISRGQKMQAVGVGAWVLVAGAMVILVGAGLMWWVGRGAAKPQR